MKSIFKNKDYFGISILLATLGMYGWYFAAKIVIFQKAGYQSDLFTHIQASRGWLLGRTIMHENAYGYHHKIHNYFFNLLMGPVVLPLGAYGLFIIELLFFLAAFFYTFPIIYKAATTFYHKLSVGLFYIVFFCGPYLFWLHENPFYGFHPEIFYVPLGFIFSISLYKKQNWVSILAAILMVAVKEDGAVIVACIQLLYYGLVWQAGLINRQQWLKKSIIWGTIWVLVFVAGVYFLRYKNDFGYDRLTEAFERYSVQTTAAKWDYFVPIIKTFGVFLLPLCIFLVFIKQINYKVWLFWLGLMVPITIVNFISGFVYFPNKYYSINWVPRFDLIFALFLSMGGLSLLLFAKPWFRPGFINLVVVAGVSVGLFYMQKQILLAERKYSYDYNTCEKFAEGYPHIYYPHWGQVRKLAGVLPYDYPVSPPEQLFCYFHKHDYVWTKDMYIAWKRPRMVICDETNRQEYFNAGPGLFQNADSLVTEKITYYFEKEDRHYLVKVGIK